MKKILFVFLCCSLFTSFLSSAQTKENPVTDWQNLKNPVYSHPDWSVKDACMMHHEGYFYLYFSAFFYDSGRERSHVVSVRTKDFKTFSEPLFIWSGIEQGWIGLCSPDIRKIKDTWVLTFNSWGDKDGQPNQLFYATTKDLTRWGGMKPLAKNITEGIRAIDAAIIPFNNKMYLVWKRVQEPLIAVGDSLNDVNWKILGRPVKPWFENGQFFELDGKVHMMVTDGSHLPSITKMIASGEKDDDWLKWEDLRLINLPVEEFNTNEAANAGSILDCRKLDGYFYVLYAGRTEGISHNRRGDNKLALARSKDLINWEIPGK